MGTENDRTRSVNRDRPPPIPPRPQHLMTPAAVIKAMPKYSSMPDILNGWKKDANPDLLKLNNNAKKNTMGATTRRRIDDEYSPSAVVAVDGYRNAFEKNVKKKFTFGCVGSKSSGGGGGDYRLPPPPQYQDRVPVPPEKNVGGYEKTSRKFSCIPGRSNSKKKKNILSSSSANDGNCCSSSGTSSNRNNNSGSTSNNSSNSNNNCRSGKNNNRTEISQTSWYVEDVGNTMVQLSKCEITLNSDNNCRYAVQETHPPPPNAAAVAAGGTVSNSKFLYKRCHGRYYLPMASSSSPLSGLPPLPKSLSDASLLRDSSDKKLSYPVSLSPSSSNASSSSRSSSVHSKVSSSPSRKNSPPQNEPKPPHEPKPPPQLSKDAALCDEKRSTPPLPPPRKSTSLDMKLAVLRKEMHDLRQMDLSLLSQLWSLNETIHEFRQMQESLSPHTPSSHSSDEDDSEYYYSNVSSQGVLASNHNTTISSNSSRSSAGTSRSNIRDNIKK